MKTGLLLTYFKAWPSRAVASAKRSLLWEKLGLKLNYWAVQSTHTLSFFFFGHMSVKEGLCFFASLLEASDAPKMLQVSMKGNGRPRPLCGSHRHYCHLLASLERLNVSSSCSNIITAEGGSLTTSRLPASLGSANCRCAPHAHCKRQWSLTADQSKIWFSPISPPCFQEEIQEACRDSTAVHLTAVPVMLGCSVRCTFSCCRRPTATMSKGTWAQLVWCSIPLAMTLNRTQAVHTWVYRGKFNVTKLTFLQSYTV